MTNKKKMQCTNNSKSGMDKVHQEHKAERLLPLGNGEGMVRKDFLEDVIK